MAEAEGVNNPTQLTVYHLVMFLHHDVSLNRAVTRLVQRELERAITTPPEQTAIDVWIESTGGDAHATYKLFLDMRSRCHQLRAIVPDYAKSAATLLLLGMDRIYLTPAAELGPLDVQLEHPDREGVTISGLEAAGSLEFITRTAISMVLAGGGSIVKLTRLPRVQVLNQTFNFIGNFYRPIIEKFDPHLVNQASKQLRVAERYATIMLGKRRLPAEQHMDADTAKKLLTKLVKDYPAHEFVISRDEAKELGLPIFNADTHPRWEVMKTLYDMPREEGNSMFCVYTDAELEAEEGRINSRAVTATEDNDHETNLHQSEGDRDIAPNGAGDGSTVERIEEVVRAKSSGGN